MTHSYLVSCQAVLFDADGVLVDSAASVDASWAQWAADYELDLSVVEQTMHGRRAADTVAMLVDGERLDEAVARIHRYELDDAGSVTAIAGAPELTAAVEVGSWAVVTSGTASLAAARLKAAGVTVPAVFVTADEVVEGKPAPEGYLLAAQRLGIAPADCVVLEDSDSGIAAARAAGMGAVIGVGAPALGTDADVVVPDLRALTWSPGGLLVDPATALRLPDRPAAG